MTSVTLPGSGGTVSFKYDPFGRRIYKSSSTATSIYAYDWVDLIEETNSTGTSVARYLQGANVDEPLVMLRGGTTSYYEQDGNNSVTSLTNAAGALAETYTFDSFGNQTASSGSLTNSFRYTGREFDTETNLHFYRARYYDQTAGRFMSEDPIRFESGINFYAYALNNPANNTDPSGLDVVVCLYPDGANGFGHVGYGFPGDKFTVGFYPSPNSRFIPAGQGQRLHGPGALWPDVGDGRMVCKLIHTTPDQDACMLQRRIERLRNPGNYDLLKRQCTGFVRDSLAACGIPTGPYAGPIPNKWFPGLPGIQVPKYSAEGTAMKPL